MNKFEEKEIPENERWLHEEPAKSKIDAALKSLEEHTARATDLDEFEAVLKRK